MLKLFVYDSVVESWMFKQFFSVTLITLHNMKEEAKLKEFLCQKEEYYKQLFWNISEHAFRELSSFFGRNELFNKH